MSKIKPSNEHCTLCAGFVLYDIVYIILQHLRWIEISMAYNKEK